MLRGILVTAMHAASMTPTTIRNRFLDDHSELEDLFAGLLDAFEANDGESVARLWNEFDDRLAKHLEAEERFVIPQLFAARPRDARAILEEHRHIRSRLVELGCGVELHTVRLDAARGFIDELRAHARHEEDVLYRWAEEHLPAAEQAHLVAQLTTPLRRKVQCA
jgi:hemerythrin-like domain-containing protein